MSKQTVTVRCSWFSSNPVFTEVLEAVEADMKKGTFMSKDAYSVLDKLPRLNGGHPFHGHTEFGPHTYLWFEAPSLAEAVCVTEELKGFLYHKFPPNALSVNFLELRFRFSGYLVHDAIEKLENSALEAQEELKKTRSFLPNKRIQGIRMNLKHVFEDLHL